MDFSNAVVVGVFRTDHREGYSSEHLSSDIVLIDQANNGIQPLLYQLNKEEIEADLSQIKQGYVGLPKGAFFLVGTVTKIDRENKLIYLSSESQTLSGEYSQHTVSYKHLIVASGITHAPQHSSQQDEDFSVAVQALIEAIKVRKNVPQNFAPQTLPSKKSSLDLLKKVLEREHSLKSQMIGDVAEEHIPTPEKPEHSTPMGSWGKRHFEIQL